MASYTRLPESEEVVLSQATLTCASQRQSPSGAGHVRHTFRSSEAPCTPAN